ncbi:MAG: AraC family transcriptional regulator [Alphaproteobacteria bacterium]|nr:AraC family transcriptional regulator [Alphaproteobacteria bacterium]
MVESEVMMTDFQNGRVTTAAGPQKRFEACFSGQAFAPHRHDTYTLALTLSGVQSFDYRGECRHSLPGELVILHPDELHTGQAGTDESFRYRGINIAPTAISGALDDQTLPFISSGRSENAELIRIVFELVQDLSRPIDPLHWEGLLAELAEALMRESSDSNRKSRPNSAAVMKARALIEDNLTSTVTMKALEKETGVDRWQLSRDFRAVLGTSPYRYVTLRRVDRAKAHIARGEGLAQTAYACGFSDQAHLTRQFKACLGVTPKRWSQIIDTQTNGTIIQ